MRYLITKTTIEMIEGDKKILFARIIAENIETARKSIMEKHPNCRRVVFTYEELPLKG